jgi:hypothetical protein
MKNLLVIAGIAILMASCTEEVGYDYRQIVFGADLEREIQSVIRWHAYEMFVELNDTIWPPGPDGNPIRMRNPNDPSKLLFTIKESELTIQEQKDKIRFICFDLLEKERERTTEIFRSYPEEIIEFIAPENMRVMNFTSDNFFRSITDELNMIRQRLVDNPGNTLSQKVTLIFRQFESLFINTCIEAFIYDFLNPSYNKDFKNN